MLDPHRPYVDDVTLRVPAVRAGGAARPGGHRRLVRLRRDAVRAAAATPTPRARWRRSSTPTRRTSSPRPSTRRAGGSTRCWRSAPWSSTSRPTRTSLCLGHILAEDGRKMSKHLGNILEPIPLMDQHGADAVRWFMLAGGSPWAARRVGHATIQEVVRKTLLTYWNTVSFQALYGRTGGWAPSSSDPAPAERPALDRWVLSRAERAGARGHLRAWRTSTRCAPGKLLSAFVDDLSNWYVRRARRRFWNADPAALATLHDRAGDRDAADGADGPVHHRAGLAGPGPPGRRGLGRGRGVGAPGRRGRSWTRRWSTRRWPSRWR